MKIVNKEKKQEQQVSNEVIVSMSEAIKFLHEAYKDLFFRLDVATNFLSISKEKYLEALQEAKDQNFDAIFISSIPENKEYKILEEGEEAEKGDSLVCSLFDKDDNMIASRMIVHVGEKFLEEEINSAKIKEKIILKTGYIIPLYGVRFL